MRIPINVNKGVLPEIEEGQEEDEQEEAYMVTTHKKKKKVRWMSEEEWCKKIAKRYAPQGVCPHGIQMYCMEHTNDYYQCTLKIKQIYHNRRQKALEKQEEEDDEPPALLMDSDDEEDIKVKVRRIYSDVVLPEYKSENAARMDIATIEEITLKPQTTTLLATGLEITIPEDHVGILKTRSSQAKSEITIKGGVIDSDYTGEILLIARNHNLTIPFSVKKKDQLAQMLLFLVL